MSSLLLLLSLSLAQQPDEPSPAEGEEPAEAPVPDDLPIIGGPSLVQSSYVEAAWPDTADPEVTRAEVVLQIELSDTGEIDRVEVSRSDGAAFEDALMDVLFEWQWEPATTEAGPVPVAFPFTYTFERLPAEQAQAEPEAPVNFTGVVLEMATRKPLQGVVVAIAGAALSATTDDEGRFELRGVEAGEQLVRLLHPGHVTDERPLTFVDGELTEAKLWMRAEAYRDNEVVIAYEREKDEVTRRTITIEEIRRVPGTFGDPVRVIQTLPGAARTPFGTGLLVIRGANPEDSGVYVDGIRIPIVYHLTGTTSVIAPDLIDSVDYLPGGYGVQYGRTMGGTIDVKTKNEFAEDGKLSFGADILDSQVFYEGKVGKNKKHGIAVGARRSYVDLFIPVFTADTGFNLKPRYHDYQLKWVPELPGEQQASVFFYGFDDVLEVSTPEDQAQGSDADTQGDLGVKYNSHRLVGRYRSQLSDTLAFDLTPSVGLDTSDASLGTEFGLTNGVTLINVRSQLEWQATPAVNVVPGVDLYGGFWWFDFRSAVRFDTIDDPLAEREPVGFDGRGSFWSPDAFLKLELRPLDDRSRWLITPGVRLQNTGLKTGGEIAGQEPQPWDWSAAVDPRVLTRYQVVPDRFALKGATGLYHQPPQPQEAVGVGTAASVDYERSWSSSVGYEHRLSDAIHYDIDLFYRSMDRQIVFDESWAGFGTNPFVNEGLGRAYGMEIIARHDPVNRFFGWVSYTLSRAVRNDYPSQCSGEENRLLGTGDCWTSFDFDQTHIFSAQAGYDLPRDFGVSAQVQYVTGNPTSPFNAGVYDADADFYNGFAVGPPNSERLPPFFQTSLRFDKLFTFKTWQLQAYVDLLNAVRGVNPEFTIYNYDYSEYAYVRGLPFIPNIGFEAKFFP
jgi:TonB family protein